MRRSKAKCIVSATYVPLYDIQLNEYLNVFICLMGMCELIDMDIIKGLKDKEEINFKREWK